MRSGRHPFVRTPGADMDQCSKTMEMFDSGTNSTVTSDFQVPFSRADKKVSWEKDTGMLLICILNIHCSKPCELE